MIAIDASGGQKFRAFPMYLWIVCFSMWTTLLMMWVKYFTLQPAGQIPKKLLFCTALTLFVPSCILDRFGKEMRKRCFTRVALPRIHVLSVAILVVAMGIFAVWAMS